MGLYTGLTVQYTSAHLLNIFSSTGHFLLTHLLLPKLKASTKARIINVSAQAHYGGDIKLDDLNHENKYTAREAFGQSKLALILMAHHMAKLLKGMDL
jgi:NAD(P)-dependent dehydrogenase (short-subunit alcohol dehydrogenase family)